MMMNDFHNHIIGRKTAGKMLASDNLILPFAAIVREEQNDERGLYFAMRPTVFRFGDGQRRAFAD